MLAKTHIAVGMAAAFSIARPDTAAEVLPVIAGGVLGCLICDLEIKGSGHRGFSHSLLALVLETACLQLVFSAAALPFAAAFASHVMLDLMNKRPIRLFYPSKKGMCLGWFYADRLANKAFAAMGAFWLIVEMILFLHRQL